MPPFNANTNQNLPEPIRKIRPNVAFVVIIFGALIAFEIFNYSTTEHALQDLLGNLTFLGLPWATVLALAFCGIDFAGIARLFTPEQGMNEPKEVWYLFVAWIMAATMNAILTWWGVSMAVITHQVQSSALVDQGTLTTIIPIFVAIMVWVIRILIIGTLSLTMDRLLHPGAEQHIPLEKVMHTSQQIREPEDTMRYIPTSIRNGAYSQRPAVSRAASPSSRPSANRQASFSSGAASEEDDLFGDEQPTNPVRNEHGRPNNARVEPTYHSVSGMSARPSNPGTGTTEGGNTGRYRRS